MPARERRVLSRCMIVTLTALALTAGIVGFVAGLRVASLDAGEIVARVAERHAEETGGSPTDCVGRPGEGRVWIEVICAGDPRRVYAISRLGFEIAMDAAPRL